MPPSVVVTGPKLHHTKSTAGDKLTFDERVVLYRVVEGYFGIHDDEVQARLKVGGADLGETLVCSHPGCM